MSLTLMSFSKLIGKINADINVRLLGAGIDLTNFIIDKRYIDKKIFEKVRSDEVKQFIVDSIDKSAIIFNYSKYSYEFLDFQDLVDADKIEDKILKDLEDSIEKYIRDTKYVCSIFSKITINAENNNDFDHEFNQFIRLYLEIINEYSKLSFYTNEDAINEAINILATTSFGMLEKINDINIYACCEHNILKNVSRIKKRRYTDAIFKLQEYVQNLK